jgi:hypothetical protein
VARLNFFRQLLRGKSEKIEDFCHRYGLVIEEE